MVSCASEVAPCMSYDDGRIITKWLEHISEEDEAMEQNVERWNF